MEQQTPKIKAKCFNVNHSDFSHLLMFCVNNELLLPVILKFSSIGDSVEVMLESVLPPAEQQ